MLTLTKSTNNLRRSSKTLKVGFIPTQVSGVAYYRMCAFAWEMRKRENVMAIVAPFSMNHLVSNPWQSDMLTNPQVCRDIESLVQWADVVVWQPVQFTHSLQFFEDMRIKYQKQFLVEVDDYVSDIPATNEAYEAYTPSSRNYQCVMACIRQADALVVSTPYLAELYKSENGNIHVIPNSLDFKGLRGRPKIVGWDTCHIRKHDRIRIGWIGGGTHSADLEMVAPALSDILDEYPGVWLYVVHGVPRIFREWAERGRNVHWTHKWTPINLYPRALASYCFDIGIAPLVDNNFNRGKSNLRWLEYSALRIPSVCSPQPDFVRSIENEKNGYLANEPSEWKNYLKLLIENPDLRVTVGRRAYNTVKERFNVKKTAKDYMNLLRGYAHG